jgi:PadR family transcriptional regulator, regulatory protein PadR
MRKRAPSRQSRAILDALLAQPLDWQHGYELSKRVGLSSGTLYPVLIRLHDRGLLEAKWVEAGRPGRPPRHAYRLTPAGVTFTRALDDDRASRPASSDEVLA